MKDVYEVLRKKELDFRRMQKDVEMLHRVLWQVELEFHRVQKEIAALHSVIPLLAEDPNWVECEPVLPPSSAQFQGTGGKGGKSQPGTGDGQEARTRCR